jgi:hypothetical protein
LLAKGLEFILVCKPLSLKTLYEWIDDLERNGIVKSAARARWTGKRHETDTNRYVSVVPLRDADDALSVNGCEITTRIADRYCIEMRSPRPWRLTTPTLWRWLPRVAQGGKLKMKTIIR